MSEAPPSTQPQEIHGFPLWVKLSAVAVAILFILSIGQIGSVVKDAVRVERGRRALTASDYQVAASQLAPIVSRYPDSTDFRLDLCEAYLGMKEYADAARTITKLEGRELDEQQEARANGIVNTLDQAAAQLKADSK